MESNKILDADFLDILFDGKNKDYGAYDLRKTYNGRLVKAMIGMGALLLFLFGGYFLSNLNGAPAKRHVEVTDFVISEVIKKKEDPVIPPPPKPIEPIKIKTLQFTSIIQIVKDVKDDAPPPKQDDLTDTKIGTVNVDGVKDGEIVAPPSDDGSKGVVEAPKKVEEDLPFMKVEKESEYPGGMNAWRRYMEKNFRYPDDAVNRNIQGVVTVQFIVDREGNVSEAHAISGPSEGGLREEAVRVIKKSGKWVPAIQNGRPVKSYKSQPVVFQIGE